ncbi:MAG: cell wall hydrolase [Halanaerobiales bacterium]
MNGVKKNMMITIIVFVLITIAGTFSANAAWQYTVRPGDTLWRVARRYGTTVNAVKNASGYWNDRVSPGQVLTIPTGGSSSAVSTGGRVGYMTAEERNLFARVIEAEAGGEPYTGKVAVASVLLNRVEDPEFPNTLKGVIYESHAFEAVTNGMIWRKVPGNDSYRAINHALNGWDPSYGSRFFWNPYVRVSRWVWSRPIVVQYGKHVFAR